MTVAAKPPNVDYLENGVTKSFAVKFRFLPSTIAASRVLANGSVVDLVPGVDFSTSGGDTDSGGWLTLSGASVAGAKLRIRRRTSRAQQARYVDDDSFPAASHEQALDRSMLVDQEQDAAIDDTASRAIMVKDGQAGQVIDRDVFAGKFFAGDPLGNMVPASGTGNDPALRIDLAQADGIGLVGFSQPGTETDIRTARDKLGERISLEDFGAVVGDEVANRAAFLKAKDRIAAHGGELVIPGKQWEIGTDLLSMDGVTIIAEAGAEIVGNWNRKASYRLRGAMTTRLKDLNYDYLPYRETAKHRRVIAEKEVFLDGISADQTTHIAIDCTGIQLFQVDWPTGDSWTSPTEAQAPTARTLSLTLTPAVWRCGLQLARGGDELSVVTSTGNYDRAAVIRTTGGYYYFFADGQSGAGHLWRKPVGGAAVLVSEVDWGGRTDHAFWQPGFATWAIRLYDLKTFSILLNGMEVVPPMSVDGLEIISHYGFGGKDDGGAVGVFSDWTIARGKDAAGRGYRGIAFFGDSRTAPYHGEWTSYCAELLEHSLGCSLLTKYNSAIDGWTSATTLTTIQNAEASGLLSTVNIAVVGVGTNDAQAGVPIATTVANVTAIIDLFQARATPIVIVLPQDFYPQALTGTGVIVFNEQNVPAVRQAIHRIAASKGCRVVDLSQVLKPVLAYEANPPAPEWGGTYETGLRDNIHNGELQYRKIGWAVARAIMAIWPEKRVGFDLSAIPPILFGSGWAASSAAGPLWQMDETQKVSLAGRLTAGTKVDGTVIMRLPPSIVPRAARMFLVVGNSGTKARLMVHGTGDVTIYDFATGGDTDLYLDGISWPAR